MKCPDCQKPGAVYQAFSGGKEGYCPSCDDQFLLTRLPKKERPLAILLQTKKGRKILRKQMEKELTKRHEVRER